MSDTRRTDRRAQIIDVAADLLREGGPDALTTVAVAARCGITQPAVYRHVENIETLTALASAIVLEELQQGLAEMADVSEPDRPDGATEVTAQVVELMARFATGYEIVARWRFSDGPLSAGITDVLDAGSAGLAFVLELRWRQETGFTEPLDAAAAAVQARHAELIRDESHAVARMVRDPDCPLDRPSLARLLANRFETGWAAYAADMARAMATAGAPEPRDAVTTEGASAVG